MEQQNLQGIPCSLLGLTRRNTSELCICSPKECDPGDEYFEDKIEEVLLTGDRRVQNMAYDTGAVDAADEATRLQPTR